MEQFDIEKQTRALEKTTIGAIKGLFPIKGKSANLELVNIWADDRLDPRNYKEQFKAKVAERTWGVPIYGSFALVDKDGKLLKKKEKIRLATLPKMTPRLSYIVGGREYQVANQLRLRPAGYIVRTGPGGLKSQINLSKGYAGQIELHMKPETGVFSVKIGQANQPLYPILNILGISDAEIAKRWGDDVLEANKMATEKKYDQTVRNFAKSVLRKQYPSADAAKKDLQRFVESTAMDPDINKRTIGKAHGKMDGFFLTDIAQSLLKTVKGEREPNDRNSLEFKEYRTLRDLVEERLSMREHRSKVTRQIAGNIQQRDKIEDMINASIINPHIGAIFNLDLAQQPKQLNPVEMFNTATMTTLMGEGGISSPHTIAEDMRDVHPSHLGFLDPLHTPEGQSTGVTYHLPTGVSEEKKTLLTRAINLKTNKLERIDPAKFTDHVIAFPGQYNTKTGKWKDPSKVVVLDRNNKTVTVPAKKVDYILQSPKQVFSVSSNLTPFLPTNSGGRALVGVKLAEQAVPLAQRESPLVQSRLGGKTTFEKLLGGAFSFNSPIDGVVEKVAKGSIVLKDESGKKIPIQLYDNFPLNDKSFIDSIVKVKKGDAVTRGQLLADTNFTQNGNLALGTNLKTAFLPYKGLNFEDAIVITDDASKKLTSEHMYTESATESDRFTIDRDKFTAYYPNVFNKAQVENLDKDGIVKKGLIIQPGDPIIARLRKDEIDPENVVLKQLSRTLIRPWRDDSIKWDGDNPAEVVDVVRHGKNIKVFLKTQEPATIGDKLVGRYGNKGVISRLIPTEQAPKDKDGNPVDIILNPHGVITRINVGQLLENAAGKVARKQGVPYVTDNFSGENYTQSIKDLLKQNDMTATEELFDPDTNTSLGQVTVGDSYIMKLDKQVKSQFSARGAGAGWRYSQNTQEPVKGGEEGSKALDLLTFYSMLGHGNTHSLLKEMATYKATKNDDFWGALKTGRVLPPPKPTFAYNKFISYMKGAGVNIKQEGSKLVLTPMTDKETSHLSNGEIKDFQFIRAKDLQEISDGLMDKKITGGLSGDKWYHIKLDEPIVNPVFENPVRSLLDMNKRTFNGLVDGTMFLDEAGEFNGEGRGVTGGKAFQQMLSTIDKKQRLRELKDQTKKSKGDKLNKINQQIRYLEALNQFELEPQDAYIINKIPILPPKYRPIYALPDGNLHTSGINFLYRDLGLANEKLRDFNKIPYMPEDAKQELRADVYKGTSAVIGLGNPIAFYPRSRKVQGIVKEIKGSEEEGSKTGFFQKHVLRREQDLVGRGAIIPDPKLGVDELGIPEKMAWTIFEPFVVRELVQQGYKPIDADKQIKERSFLARKALEAVMAERPVLMNRAPSLHKFSIMAFKPQITQERAVKIPLLVNTGFNADFDGNCLCGSSKLTLKISKSFGIRTPNQFSKEFDMKFKGETRLLGIDDGNTVMEIQIRDFPRTNEPPITDKNGALVYKVPGGISVLSYEHGLGKVVFSTVTGLTVEEKCDVCKVITNRNRSVVASTNESLCVYDHETGLLRKKAPSESVGHLSPVIHRMPTFGIKYNFETGWMIGAFASDGFFMGERTDYIGYSKASTPHRDRFANAVSVFKSGAIKRHTYNDFHDATKSITGTSVKDHLSDIGECSALFEKCYLPKEERGDGRACLYKKLPDDIYSYSKEALLGILSGLLDGDGSVSWSYGKKKRQFMASINTSSVALVDSVKVLLKLIGIRHSVTPYYPKEGRLQKHVAYIITISSVDLEQVALKLKLTGEGQAILNEFISEGTAKDNFDIIPVPFSIMQQYSSKQGEWAEQDPRLQRSLSSIKSAKNPPYISRSLASRVVPFLEKDNELHQRWKITVESNDIFWDVIKTTEPHDPIQVFDLVIPDTKVFATNDGLVVYDTMVVHTPVLPDAVEEAKQMFPSKHLFNPGTGNIMLKPQQEAAIGLYFLSKDGENVTDKTFAKVETLAEALDKKEVNLTDIVRIGKKETAAGKALIDAVLPKPYRGRNIVLDKKNLGSLLTEIAQNHPKDYANTVNKLTELGNKYAYQSGFTVSIDDIQPDFPEKEAILERAKRLSAGSDDRQKIEVYQEADKEIKRAIHKRLDAEGNNLYQMIKSGARGNIDQLKQIVSTPLLVEDVRGNTLPIPIENSFSKGLNIDEYWNSLYGSRKGVVDKTLQTSKPGEFNKDLMATVIKNVITDNDCGTQTGLDFSIDDVDGLDRILTKDVVIGKHTLARTGDIITPNMVSKFRSSKVKKFTAHSPLTCEKPHGTCAKCYGIDPSGNFPAIGDNIGAITGQSLTEPLTQMVLRSMHSGGVAGAQQLTGYEKIDKLVRMPKIIHGSATLAKKDGKITSIDEAPAGGRNVFIGGESHFVPQTNLLKVKTGTNVKKGDALSHGIIQPRELVELKGMFPTQRYIVDELTDAYRGTGVNIKKKNIETVVRSLANTTTVLDGGDSPFGAGDVVPYTVAETFNKKVAGKLPLDEAIDKVLFKDQGPIKKGTKVTSRIAKILQNLGHNEVNVGPDPIIHKPFVTGVKQLPLLSKDWMAQLGYGHIVRSIKEGAGEAWTTDIHDYSPVPAFAYGAEFGEGKQGRY